MTKVKIKTSRKQEILLAWFLAQNTDQSYGIQSSITSNVHVQIKSPGIHLSLDISKKTPHPSPNAARRHIVLVVILLGRSCNPLRHVVDQLNHAHDTVTIERGCKGAVT